jgi:hypothetical protein
LQQSSSSVTHCRLGLISGGLRPNEVRLHGSHIQLANRPHRALTLGTAQTNDSSRSSPSALARSLPLPLPSQCSATQRAWPVPPSVFRPGSWPASLGIGHPCFTPTAVSALNSTLRLGRLALSPSCPISSVGLLLSPKMSWLNDPAFHRAHAAMAASCLLHCFHLHECHALLSYL